MKKGLLIINVGTPNSPQVKDVRNYLGDFLNDPLVIQMPTLLRQLLVKGIIVPFRGPKSAKRYQKVWTKEGSPLLTHLLQLEKKLKTKLADTHAVYAAMNYGKPDIKDVVKQIEVDGIEELTVLPLFPHYAASTTLSTINNVKSLTAHWKSTKVSYIKQFYNAPRFISAVSSLIAKHPLSEYEHILFSYHSLPLKQVKQSNILGKDYEAVCYETTQLLADHLHLTKKQYSTAFQSRFSKRWLAPFTNEALTELAHKGKKKTLVVCPSFVADCLETTLEIGVEYRDEYLKNGGTDFQLVECVNSSDEWVDAVIEIIS